MKYNKGSYKIATGVVLGAALACASSALATNEFDYSGLVGADINFTGGGQFDFTPTTSFKITATDLTGSADNLQGGMSGTYTMGAITTIAPGVTSAPVTGSGGFFINDGLGHMLTGTLSWLNIEQVGTGTTANYLASVNLTSLSYSGVNADLLTLAGQSSVIDTLNFTFVPSESLAQMEAGGLATSFSGSINGTTPVTPPPPMVPDGGMTVALMGGALVALGGLRRKLGC